ncbi:ABC transporter substrate-binding protein [Clavibacter sp. VKM Ac-2542]|uniref:ABC transporter substrate-binding protein n=1 Tax=Clavibacter sp. VKM Ac-2542 TaxID=2783811 RepID=UPI00188D0608|nr:ABC transporter substrate-binding protein [Clavibacter sp. VKM Ac-2542]MBF4621442.1 ABC transporter substrate-binding protein [Clavibacter sp. VKM Ac-2542]
MSGLARRVLTATTTTTTLLILATACTASTPTTASAPGAASGSASMDGYPVTITNCGRELTIDAEPQRVVSLWQSTTEALLALGLRDRIVAVQEPYAPYPDSVARDAAGLPTIGGDAGFPSKEVLLSEAPDFVTGQVLDGYAFDASRGYATVEQLEQTGATVYGANLCTSADAQSTDTWNIESALTTLRDYGIVFGVSAKADEVIGTLRDDEQKVIDAVEGAPTVRTAFFNGGTGPLNVLAGGLHDDLIRTAGGEDVFPASSVYVSKEEFAASDADVILVGTYPGQDFATQKEFLEQTFPDLPAVSSGRISEVPTQEADSSISVMVGLTRIANALHPDLDLPVPSS